MRFTVVVRSARHLNVVGLANGHAGRHLGCEQHLTAIQNSLLFKHSRIPLKWRAAIEETVSGRRADALKGVIENSRRLSSAVRQVLEEQTNSKDDNDNLLVFGGDHSCAIGTWSGVASAMRPYGDVGLIWVDAHMDAHTIESSPTKNLHGTPVAHLLGIGERRNYPEQELMNRLGVRVFYDSEVQRRGIAECMNEAIALVNRETIGFGMSIDLDAFRVQDAPAVGTPEVGGINAAEFLDYIRQNPFDARLLATEIVEFMAHKDDAWRRSERLVFDLVESIYLPKIFAEEFEAESEQPQRRAVQ
ncbi:Arginase [Aphelenchoides fujianensis]|nr:Arginase [Aphelenchoides fujianensis]